jgi:anti-anti-sigma factor
MNTPPRSNLTVFSGAQGLTVQLPKEIVSTNVAALRTELLDAIERPVAGTPAWTTLNLDCSSTRQIDSAGLNLIVSIVRVCQTRGAKVKALVTHPTVERAFRFTRLDQYLDLVKA